MAARYNRKSEVTFFAGSATVVDVPRSRIKIAAAILGIILAAAPAPWAFKTFDSRRDSNGTKPAGTHEKLQIIPGVAIATRNGQPQPATYAEGRGVYVDLGEIRGGSSSSYVDLFRLQNNGEQPLLVSVQPEGITQAPAHASVGGDKAPGTYWVPAGGTVPVDMGVAADLIGEAGDIEGSIIVKTASGLINEKIPARLTVTAPSADSVLAALIAAAGENPRGGFDRLGDSANGLDKPDYKVEGVWDGGAYNHDVTINWRPVGPLTNVSATLDGQYVGRTFTVGNEGKHLLVLEAKILGSVEFRREINFTIDKAAPTTVFVPPAVTFNNPATFQVKAADRSPVVGVDVVLVRQTSNSSQPSPSPSATPAPTASPTPTPSASSSPSPSSSPTPTPTPTPKPTATPSPTPSATPSAPPAPAEVYRVAATYDKQSDTWTVSASVPPGTYLVHAEAVDIVGNRTITQDHTVEVIAPPVLLPSR